MHCWNCGNAISFLDEPCYRCGVSLKTQRLHRVVIVVVASLAVAGLAIAIL